MLQMVRQLCKIILVLADCYVCVCVCVQNICLLWFVFRGKHPTLTLSDNGNLKNSVSECYLRGRKADVETHIVMTKQKKVGPKQQTVLILILPCSLSSFSLLSSMRKDITKRYR